MIVTNDNMEYPIKEVVGGDDVAKFLGIRKELFYKYMVIGFPKKYKYKVVVIKDIQDKDGNECQKNCEKNRSNYYKNYYKKNKERILIRNKAYRERHVEQKNEYNKKYYRKKLLRDAIAI